MKFIVVAVVFLSAVAADVSHLKKAYLPPVAARLTQKHHISYVEKNQGDPQAPLQEVVDNYVLENISAKEEMVQSYDGQPITESPYFSSAVNDHIQTSKVLAQHVQNSAALARRIKAHTQQPIATMVLESIAPNSVAYQSTLANYYTHVNQQRAQNKKQGEQYSTGAIVNQYDELSGDAAFPQQIPEQNYNVGQHAVAVNGHKTAVTVPAIQKYSEQQKTRYYDQQSYMLHSTATNGVDTQYADNGGYVY